MNVATLVQTWGYPAVFLGTFLEGETVLVAAGFAAQRGYLSLPLVMLIAAVASFLGDQTFFWIGRLYGPRLLARLPRLRPAVERVAALLTRHHTPVILSVRFLYGLRIAGPMAIGMSGVPWRRFLVLNLLGAVAWAMIISAAGYGLGQVLHTLIADLRQHEALVLAALLATGILWALLRRAAARRATQRK